ncbi:MAG: lipid-A-disaccharide synthase N-terminal domain-containing protein [Rhizomicrobium sp.]
MNGIWLWLQHAQTQPYDTLWLAVGFLGQAVFGVRFLIQWLRSEQAGHSVVPITFWYVSVVGGLISFVYAIHLHAWPLVLGQAMPLPIYLRNIYMIQRDRRRGGPGV